MIMATIGIDFGTFNSAASYITRDGKVVLLQAYHGPTFQGDNVIPSFIKFMANGMVEKDGEKDKYGEKAREDLAIAPHLVVWGIKRLLGQDYQSANDKGELGRFRYPIEEAEDGSIDIPIGSKRYTPTEITKLLLQNIKADCEDPSFNPIGVTIEKAIITHPAYFDANQIQALRDAAREVEFEEVELITEPEAAANAYKDILDFSSERKKWVMTIDWGAGTLDIVISKFSLNEEGRPKIVSAFPAYGDPRLGGMDIDDALFEEVKNCSGLDDLDLTTSGKLRLEIEKGKIELSEKPTTKKFCMDKGRGKNIKVNMAVKEKDIPSGENKERWIILEKVLGKNKVVNNKESILERFKTHINFAMTKNGITTEDMDQLILVGGPMYMPCVREAIADVFEDNENVLSQLKEIDKNGFPVSPLEAVVRGAIIKTKLSDGLIKDSFGYGYLLDRMAGEILIHEGTVRPGKGNTLEKKEKDKLNKLMAPGEPIQVSLLKKVTTPDGENFFRMGDYEFVPIVRMGTAFSPILEMDSDGVITLKMVDYYSSSDLFTIKLSKHQEIEIMKPASIKEWMKLFEELTPEERERINEIRQAEMEKQREKPISVDKVREIIATGNAYINFIESRGKENFSSETAHVYEKLKKDIKKLPEKELPPEQQHLYTNVKSCCETLKNKFVTNDKISEEEINHPAASGRGM